MIQDLKIIVNDKEYKYGEGTTLYEISKDFQKDFKYPIIIAKINGHLKELNVALNNSCEIEFFDLTSPEGNRCHINGLTYLLLYSYKRLFGNKEDIMVRHSLDKGLYIETTAKLTEDKVNKLKEEMKRNVEAQMPIRKATIDRIEAINYFEDIGDSVKAGTLKYNTNNYITLYRLGDLYNYFYDVMPCSTGFLKDFDLTYLHSNGLVLRYPTVYINDKIKKYEHHKMMFDMFKEYHEWAELMHLLNAVDLNETVAEGRISDLIKIDEILQSGRLLRTAQEISLQSKKIKIVLLAGPSSSGKTTTSRKLCMYLQSFGLNPRVLSMDNYFVELKDNPKDKNGEYDFECLEAIDLKLFDKQVADLLKGEEIEIPTYNFYTGKKQYEKKMVLGENDIIVIEGIHALDSKILTNTARDKKFKIYICPITELSLDNHNRISTSDNRLLRRIVRDARTRNNSVEETLKQWPKVREGEEKYIYPYQDEADAIINSAAIYEIGVLKTYVEPLLYSVPKESEVYEEARRLINVLRLFLPIPSDSIPEDAVFREFIGKSYFEQK